MFDLQLVLQSADCSTNCSTDSDHANMYIPVFHTYGRSIKKILSVR